MFAKLIWSLALPLGLTTAACKGKTKPATKSATTTVVPSEGSGVSATLKAPATPPAVIAPPDLSAPSGLSTELDAALAAWNKGSPDTVGLAVKGLVDWSKARGAMPALPPRPIDAQPARYALFKMARTLIETRSEDPALGSKLRCTRRSACDASDHHDGSYVWRPARRRGDLAQQSRPHSQRNTHPPTTKCCKLSLLKRAKWRASMPGKKPMMVKTMAAAKAEAAAAGSNATGPTLPTDADQLAAIEFFAAVTKNMPPDKTGFLVHLKSQCDLAGKSSSKLLVDVSAFCRNTPSACLAM